jgi:hypothetical protein
MAAHTASGQPLHTNPPCCTIPATRKFTSRLFMGSPPSGLVTRLAAFTPPGRLFIRYFSLPHFSLNAYNYRAVPPGGARSRGIRVPGQPC